LVWPSIQIDTGRPDNGTSLPAPADREFKFSDTIDNDGGRKRNNDRNKNKRGEREKKLLPTEWNPKFGKCRLKINGVACHDWAPAVPQARDLDFFISNRVSAPFGPGHPELEILRKPMPLGSAG
jgi:hypothetical protein